MTKFIIIKKNLLFSNILKFLIVFSLLLISFLFLFEKKSIMTFSSNNENLFYDFDGDGNDESVEILKEKNKYLISVNNSKSQYVLTDSNDSKYLGDFTKKWPLKIDLIDLSRDNIPEIIVRTSIDNQPINYIFSWNGKDFSNILTTTDNIIGILDSNNNRSLKLFTLSSRKGDSSSKSYMFLGNEVKDITFSNLKVPSLSSIQKFIDIIEAPYNLEETPNIFSINIPKDELSKLWHLNKDSYRYSFQNGYFIDTNWNSSLSPSKLTWLLSFDVINYKDDSILPKELLIYVSVSEDNYKELKISSIKFN